MAGIKESKDALIAINTLAVFLVEQFKDGVQFKDFMELYAKVMADDLFKQKMMDAYVGVSMIPEEMKDLDAKEIIELSSLQLSFIPEIIDSLKKSPDVPT